MPTEQLQNLLEAALMAYGKTMSVDKMMQLFDESQRPSIAELKAALESLAAACEGRGVELTEVASGYRFQARQDYAEWLARLWEEKPPRYSRALLETIALIAYRQPITRAEIEEVRGVSVSSHIVKTLLEREWVRVVGHRDVPGKPALYATTKQFLDYFNLKSLDELPTLAEIRDLDKINAELNLDEQAVGNEAEQTSQGDVAAEYSAEQAVKAIEDSVIETLEEVGEAAPIENHTSSTESTDELIEHEPANDDIASSDGFDVAAESDSPALSNDSSPDNHPHQTESE